MESREHDRRAPAEFYYRRDPSLGELMPAIGAGVAAGLAVFYVARLFVQRTPLRAEARIAEPRIVTAGRR